MGERLECLQWAFSYIFNNIEEGSKCIAVFSQEPWYLLANLIISTDLSSREAKLLAQNGALIEKCQIMKRSILERNLVFKFVSRNVSDSLFFQFCSFKSSITGGGR